MAGTRLCGAPKPSLPTASKPTTLATQARRTFQESFDSFEKTVQQYSRTDDREFSNTTLRDVRDAAKEVERHLAARQCMRNMKRLEPFLDGLEAYSKVIEVLCNGTPFLSWIWAPIKLMMQLATDHISAFEKLLAAYSQIAAMLPRFDRLGTALQDKPDFQQALAVVYSDILTFHEHAYKLFRRNGWMCFFKSSWGQFGSRFNCILESLKKHTTLIDQEANAYLISETMQWRREALQAVAKTEKDRSTAQLTAALAWLGLETVPHCGQAYQDNLLHRLINDCCDGTTDWILKHQRMRQWLQHGRGGPILWLKGKPGSGKSTLCAKILQFLRAPRQSTVLFCFYSYIVSSTYPDPVVFILATLVSQVLRQRSDLATYVYEEFVAESRPLSIRSLQELLSNLLPQLVMPRILIDGIDECIRYDIHGKPCDLTPVKDVLGSILQLENPMQACAPTKILIVSRDILELVGKLSKRPTVALDQESDALTADITRYATKCLETIRVRFSNLIGVDNVLNDVKRNVVLKSQGMFLWVRLVLAQLEFDAYNLDDLENAVANMPHSLHDFYSRIVHRIMLYPTQSRERTINILKWMMCSRRPLRVIELQDAIVFASGAVSLSERSKLPPNIVDLCKPLIQTDDNGQISFVHFTVQEYLTKSNFISLQDAESCTTITCLNYLTFSLNLSNASGPATQKAVDVGRCLYSLQPYAHEHWLDHLLAFAAEVSRSTDQQLEAFLASFFFIYSHRYTRYLDPTDDLEVDILAAQTLEPRLQYLERYEHHYKFLCAYVVYRHAKQMHFENPADYRQPLDPTPLSVIQHEYATQIDYLLSAVTVPGLTQEQLSTFKISNRLYAFVCRFPGCTGMLAGFPTDDLRTQHEMTHKPALFCTHSGCKYSLPFASQQNLRKHIRDFHDSRSKVVSKSIRRRQATLLRGQSGHAPTPSPLGDLDAQSQAQRRTERPSNSLQQNRATDLNKPVMQKMQQNRAAPELHHFIQHYRVQQQQGKIPDGWQQSTPSEERGQLAFQFFTQYRMLNPEMEEDESMDAALHFETVVFTNSETKVLYVSSIKGELITMTKARQQQVQRRAQQQSALISQTQAQQQAQAHLQAQRQAQQQAQQPKEIVSVPTSQYAYFAHYPRLNLSPNFLLQKQQQQQPPSTPASSQYVSKLINSSNNSSHHGVQLEQAPPLLPKDEHQNRFSRLIMRRRELTSSQPAGLLPETIPLLQPPSLAYDTRPSSPSQQPPQFRDIDHTSNGPRQQSPVHIVRSLSIGAHSPTTPFPPVSAYPSIDEYIDFSRKYNKPKADQNVGHRVLGPASAAPTSQSFNPIIPVPDGPNTTSPPITSIEFPDELAVPLPSTPTHLSGYLDANDPYLPDLAINKDPGAPRPSSSPDFDRDASMERYHTFNLSPTRRISLEEEESSTIRCICSYTEDDGNTVLCEKCDTWQHIACYYDSARHVPDIHECVHCLPRAIDSEKANEKQSILRRRLTRGPKTNGLQKRARSHSRKVDPSGSPQPEQTTVNVQSFLQHFHNDPTSRWQPIAPTVRAQTAYQFFSVYSQKWLHHDDLAMNLALQSETKIFERSSTLDNYMLNTNQDLNRTIDPRAPGAESVRTLPRLTAPISEPHLSERIRLKVYELNNNDWVESGIGICTGFVMSPKQAEIMVKKDQSASRILFSKQISKDDDFKRQKDTLILCTGIHGSDVALSFESVFGCARIWDYVKEVLRRLREGRSLL